jgi:Ice-binding-like/PEP-CTERM motif
MASKIPGGIHPIKSAPLRMTVQKRTRTLRTLSAFALAITSPWSTAQAASVLTVDLGSASAFAILAGSGITISAAPGTLITGDIGSDPTDSITGLENATHQGVNQGGNGVTEAAKIDLAQAYDDAAGRTANFSYADGFVLTGTLDGGVHRSAGSFSISGPLTLDAGGDSSMVWIFQTGSTLEAAFASQVILANGALASNVFWQVGSSATLLATAEFVGTILALESISMTTGVSISGGVYARNGAVTIGSAVIAVPEPSAPLLLGIAASGFCLARRKKSASSR